MNLQAIAQAYVQCVDLEERARIQSPELADDLSNLRADLHVLLMEALRESDVHFADRADAARMAYQLVQK